MSYTKYNTPGIVIGGSNIGEASRSYNILTREFGLVRVKAQGVRELKSKLKYNLQNLFFIDLYLVRGRNGWHITEVYKEKSLRDIFINNNLKLKSSARILFLLKKMLPEEEGNRNLFDIIDKGFDFLNNKDLSKEDTSLLETLIVLRVLGELGYIEHKESFKDFLQNLKYDKDILLRVKSLKKDIIREINQAIKESGL